MLKGLLFPEENFIFINPAKTQHLNRDDMTKTLVHELLHVLFPDTDENSIRAFEDIIWQKLNNEQKEILKSYLPK